MVTNLIPFPEPDAKAHADAETELKKQLFAWAEGVLQQLGLAAKVAQAMRVDALRKITLDVDDVEIALAIRDALHPAGGQRAKHFVGLRAGALKRLLKLRFAEMKKDRETALLRG